MPALRTAVALLLCHTAACFLGARPALKLRVARAESDDGDDTGSETRSLVRAGPPSASSSMKRRQITHGSDFCL